MCLAPECVDQPLICTFCLEEDHKEHSVKTLKKLLNNIVSNIRKISGVKVDIEKGVQLVHRLEKEAMEKLVTIRTQLNVLLDSIEGIIASYDTTMLEQFKAKELEEKQFSVEKVLEMLDPRSPGLLKANLKQLLTFYSESDIKCCTQEDVESHISMRFESVTQKLTSFSGRIEGEAKAIEEALDQAKQENIWFSAEECFFESEMKHADIKIISPNTVKSGVSNSYKIAVLNGKIGANFNC